MKRIINKHIFPIIIVAIVIVIAAANYEPGTILSGWDTLHPEFNFGEYFKRIFFGAWQEHQGLGSLAAQAHASELPRIIFYYIMSFVIPDSFLRYSYFFIALILGPLGVFYFLRDVIFNKRKEKRNYFSFLGALFYLLNLITVQHFFVPFEMFATHYASLGWLFLFALKYIFYGERKLCLYFAICTILASSMAHTATLWYSYFFTIVIFLGVFNIFTRNKAFLKRSLFIVFITIFLNLFWILPDLYFLFTSADSIAKSKIHTLFTQEAFIQNASFGRIQDLAIFKNFLFNWGVYEGNGHFDLLLKEWQVHLQNSLILLLGYVFSFIILLGLFNSIKNRNKTQLSFLTILAISVFFWLNINPPFGFIFIFFQDNIPLFKEALRFPFTKFSILLIFSSAIYFSLGLSFLDEISQKIKKNVLFSKFLLLSISILLIIYMYPAFKGYLISPHMRVSIPKEYQDLFNWLDKKEPGKVANLPIHTFWGWTYYDWGYQGAGFLWFGIKYPLLDREFDRWSPINEQYSSEMSYAIYSKDSKLFKNVLEKYNIKYVLIDKSVIAPDSYNNSKLLFFDETENLLKENNLTESANFGKISIYENKVNEKNNVFLIKNPASIEPSAKILYKDYAFSEYGDYIAKNDHSQIYFPFRDIVDNQSHFLLNLTEEKDGIKLPIKTTEDLLTNFPNYKDIDSILPVDITIEKDSNQLDITLYPTLPYSNLEEKPLPLTMEASLLTKNFIISVNKSNNFLVTSPSDKTPYSLGKLFIKANENNSISLYEDVPKKTILLDFSKPIYSLFDCGQKESDPSFGINQFTNGGFSLFAKNMELCMTTPLSKLISSSDLGLDTEVLLGIDFSYEGKEEPSMCLSSLENSNCVYYFSKKYLIKNSDTKISSQYYAINADDLGKLNLKIYIDARGSKQKITQTFENLAINITPPSFSTEITPQIIQASLDYTKQKKTNEYFIDLPYSGNRELSREITDHRSTGGDCSIVNPRGPILQSKVVLKTEQDEFIRYNSEEGSFCDHFSYEGLPRNQSYLVSIVSRNIEGLPIRLCITNNYSKRCDIYTHLTSSPTFKKEYFLLPSMGDGEGFDININNFAIKRIPSINDLKSINIIPIPLNWLSLIKTGDNKEKSVRLSAKSVEHPNPSLYLVSLPTSTSSEILTLSQSFENGWKAYEVNNLGIISQIFPFMFGKEIKKHILVNNWANGWEIDNVKEKSIIIVYLPQYLEYFGFILLLILPFTMLLIRPKN